MCYKTGGSKQGTELSSQLIDQYLGVNQVGGVEALGKPIVDGGEHRARLIAVIQARRPFAAAPRGQGSRSAGDSRRVISISATGATFTHYCFK
jgi:hypothetical protein